MHMNEYQDKAGATAIYPGRGSMLGLMYAVLKLNGEAGEVSEKLGKVIRDDKTVLVIGDNKYALKSLDQARKNDLKKELGDCLWYIAAIATELGCDLSEVAEANLFKLADRQERGVLSGSGDNR